MQLAFHLLRVRLFLDVDVLKLIQGVARGHLGHRDLAPVVLLSGLVYLAAFVVCVGFLVVCMAFMSAHRKPPYITPSMDFPSWQGIVQGRRGQRLGYIYIYIYSKYKT